MATFTEKIKKIIQILREKDGTTSYPPYIDYSNDIVLPIPGVAPNITMYCFMIDSDYGKLQSMCDERLNFAPQSQKKKYFPMVRQVLLVYSEFKNGETYQESYKKYGYLGEHAAQIFVPVVECSKNRKGEWEAERMMLFCPYIFVSNDFSMAAGREQLGFPKNVAKLNFPDDPITGGSLSVDAFGFQKFDKQNPEYASWHPLMSIDQIEANPNAKDSVLEKVTGWMGTKEAWDALKDIFTTDLSDSSFKIGLPFIIHEIEDLFGLKVPMVFLKQFRDIANPLSACYQAVVESNGHVTGFHGGWFMEGKYKLTISDFDSFPMKNDFGWTDETPVKHAFWIKCDLVFETGKEVWKA